MELIEYVNNRYHTPEGVEGMYEKLFPSFSFYCHFLGNIYSSARLARRGLYDTEAWRQSSFRILRALERTGLKFSISGIEHLQSLDSACVIVGNHMSMMDTVIIPAIVCQERPLTFIIKESLLSYPVFKHVMRSRNPIALGRKNPREDLKTVMTEGVKRLAAGISVTVFPQTTRGVEFNPRQFNTIGIKLAARAGVPVLPLALKTDAWTNGTLFKDLGRINPTVSTHFSFGPPLNVQNKGKEEHQQIIDFISAKLKSWQS